MHIIILLSLHLNVYVVIPIPEVIFLENAMGKNVMKRTPLERLNKL